jgi:hypothetical protein
MIPGPVFVDKYTGMFIDEAHLEMGRLTAARSIAAA